MREISARMVTEAVARLFVEAAYNLPADMIRTLEDAAAVESSAPAAVVLRDILENAMTASEGVHPLCQDCGMAVVFIDLGQEVMLIGGGLAEAVDEGVRRAYSEGYLRCSIVADPLYDRRNTGDNTPAKLHVRIVPGDRVAITVAPKGFGSENMSAIAMLAPAAGVEGVVDFVVGAVDRAGAIRVRLSCWAWG